MNKYEDELDLFLNDILNVSKKVNLKIWLEAGTLLGCIRNNNYIPWEKDIDFGSWINFLDLNKYKSFKKKMIEKKYIINKTKNVITIKKLGFNCHADIGFYKKIGDEAVIPLNYPISKMGRVLQRLLIVLSSKNISKTLQFHKSNLSKTIYRTIYYIFNFLTLFRIKDKILKLLKKLVKKNSKDVSWKIPVKFLKKQKKIKFRKFNILIPSRSSDYMKFRYGKNWKTPRSSWNQFVEDKSINRNQKNA